MMALKQSSAVAHAIHTPQPVTNTTPDYRSRPSSPPKEKSVYFDLCIYYCADPNQPERVETLLAGKPYMLVVTGTSHKPLSRKNLQIKKTPVAGAFSLILSCRYDPGIETPLLPSKEEKSFSGLLPGDAEYAEYEVLFPTNLPAGMLTLSLEIKTSSQKYPRVITCYTLPVQGHAVAPAMEIFTVSQINQRLPQQTAILLVETATRHSEQRQLIRLRGWSEAGQQLDKTALMQNIVSIEKLQEYRQKKHEAALNPAAILKRLTHFSRHTPKELLHWLNQLFADYHEQLNLVIVDLTDRETPWELVEFQPGRHLGAHMRVARWLPTQYFTELRTLSIEPEWHTGPVLSYLDLHLGEEQIEPEQEALQALNGQSYPSLLALRKRLNDSLENVGLIYIGCHGANGQHLLQENVPELSSIMLEGMHKSPVPQPTVFINACESARIIKGRPDDASNFVATFLEYGAAGFIGTLARVGVKNASLIANQILLAALEPDGVQVAELLRTLREYTIEQLQQQTALLSSDHYLALDCFMYVYYGNPLTRLQLHPRKEPQA